MTSNSIQQFNFHNNEVRVLKDEQGEPWFVAKDVCDILELGNVSQAVSKLDDDEKSNITNNDIAQNGGKAPLIVSEAGLYSLVLKSRKPEAREFRRWVTHEVLPQIRRTGGYVPVSDADTEKTILAKAALIAQKTMQQQERTIRAQQAELEERRPLALLGESFLATNDTMSVTQAARHFQTIDQRMTRDMVYGLLRGAGYIEVRSNAPTVKAIKPGYMVQRQYLRDGREIGKPYSRFTPKGIDWFIRRFIYGNAPTLGIEV